MTVTVENKLFPEVQSFLEGDPLKGLVAGKYVAASGGETFATYDPGSGARLADVCDLQPDDIDQALSNLMKTSHLATVLLVLTFCLLPSTSRLLGAEQPSRNIILIMADDLGAEGLACYGSESFYTPRLDAMAASGARFENAYTTPICTPTRVMIMTGLYPANNGFRFLISQNPADRLKADMRTFGHYFRDAGYATAIAGKWQLGQFDHHPQMAVESGFDEYCLWKWYWQGKKTSRFYGPAIWQNGKSADGDESVYGPDVFADFLLDFIDRKKKETFFIYFPMALVHAPFVLPPHLEEATEEALQPELRKDKKIHAYAHMITYMDAIVGRILDRLDEHGLTENTLVLFTGDNGCPTDIRSVLDGIKLRGGKSKMIETGSRVPLLARWPGTIEAGQVRDELISLADMVPTLNAIGDIETTDPVDGVDLSHLLLGTKGEDREDLFIHLGKDFFLRDHRWRLHRDGRLYDISTRKNSTRYAEKLDENPGSKAERARLDTLLAPYAEEVEAAEGSGVFGRGLKGN